MEVKTNVLKLDCCGRVQVSVDFVYTFASSRSQSVVQSKAVLFRSRLQCLKDDRSTSRACMYMYLEILMQTIMQTCDVSVRSPKIGRPRLEFLTYTVGLHVVHC